MICDKRVDCLSGIIWRVMPGGEAAPSAVLSLKTCRQRASFGIVQGGYGYGLS